MEQQPRRLCSNRNDRWIVVSIPAKALYAKQDVIRPGTFL